MIGRALDRLMLAWWRWKDRFNPHGRHAWERTMREQEAEICSRPWPAPESMLPDLEPPAELVALAVPDPVIPLRPLPVVIQLQLGAVTVPDYIDQHFGPLEHAWAA
jgi:hypothetical protein